MEKEKNLMYPSGYSELERINELLARMGMYPFARKTTSTEDNSRGGDSAGL